MQDRTHALGLMAASLAAGAGNFSHGTTPQQAAVYARAAAMLLSAVEAEEEKRIAEQGRAHAEEMRNHPPAGMASDYDPLKN